MTTSARWPTTTIGELFAIGAGKTLNAVARTTEPKHPFLRTSNVLWGRLNLGEVDRMHYTDDDLRNKTLEPGDLLVCEGGDIGRAAVWDGSISSCGFQNHLHRLRPRVSGVVPAFFMYALQAGFTLHARYEGAGNRTTIPNLSRGRLENLEVPLPPTDEQKHIAGILALVQHAIELESRSLAALQELRETTMTRVFAGGLARHELIETELGALPGHWDVAPLGEVCTLVSGGTPSKAEPAYWKGSIPWASPKDIKLPRLRDTEDHISEDGLAAGSKLVPAGSVLVVVRGMILMRDVPVALADVAMAINQDLKAIIPGPRLDSAYLLYAITAFKGRLFQKVGRSAHGTRTLLSHELSGFLIPIPSRSEQEEIAALLTTIDQSCVAHQRRHDALRDLFTGLLDKLLSGELPVETLERDTTEVISA